MRSMLGLDVGCFVLRQKSKGLIDNSIQAFTKFYPAGAVQANLPFPFVKGG
jgi:hypothetical protein